MSQFLKKFEEHLVGICLLAISFLVFLDIISRYFLNLSLVGIEEIGLLFFIYLIFFGSVVGTRERAHIEVDTIFKLLSNRGQWIVSLINECLVLIFLIMLTVVGIKLVVAQSVFRSASFEIPVSFFSLPLPVASALMAGYTAKHLWRLWSRKTKEGQRWLE